MQIKHDFEVFDFYRSRAMPLKNALIMSRFCDYVSFSIAIQSRLSIVGTHFDRYCYMLTRHVLLDIHLISLSTDFL